MRTTGCLRCGEEPETPPVLVTYRWLSRNGEALRGVLCVPCAVTCGFTPTTLDAEKETA